MSLYASLIDGNGVYYDNFASIEDGGGILRFARMSFCPSNLYTTNNFEALEIVS